MPQLLLGSGADALDLLADPYMATVGSSWGEWVAITTTTDSLFLDGSIVSGEQSGNRTIAVQVLVRADPRPSLVRACELLFAQANKQANTLTFVPDDGVPVVYDVFRAQPERTDDQSEAWGYRTYTFTFPALPFARSQSRVSTGALAPGVMLADFESAITAVAVGSPGRPSTGTEFGMPYDQTLAEASWVQVLRAPTLTAVAGASVANGQTYTPAGSGVTYPSSNVTATASTLEVYGPTVACTAASVTGGFNVFWDNSVFSPRVFTAAVEWLDGSGAVVRTDWSAPQKTRRTTSGWTAGTIWAAGLRPSSATQVRLRLRSTAAVAGEIYRVFSSAVIPNTQGSYTGSTGYSHDGGHSGLLASSSLDPGGTSSIGGTTSNPQGSAYFSGLLASPVDISAKPYLQMWVLPFGRYLSNDSAQYDTVSLRLTDSSGNWSRYDSWNVGSPGGDGWQLLTWSLGEPTQSSATPANRGSVSTWSVCVVRDPLGSASALVIDQVAGIDQPTATTSGRGTVYQLDVLGSARSTARVEVSSATPLTDLVVASVFSDSENPLLRVSSSVATSPAPAVYGGVYSVVGAVAPATALSSPTCVVAQLIGGTQVASVTLTGQQVSGNHYVDFGQLPLPLVAVPEDNVSVSYTFTLAPSSVSWTEVLVLNAAAPLTWVQNLTMARRYAWVDEPVLPAQVGRIYVGTASDRTDARALLSPPVQARPFQVTAPLTRLLVYSTTNAPNVTLDYYPRWLVEPDA